MLCKRMKKNCIMPPAAHPIVRGIFLPIRRPRLRRLFCPCLLFADGDPLTVVNNLSTFIFSLIRAIGLILLGWGIVQVGLSLQSHDPSQRSQGISHACGRAGHYVCKRNLGLDHGHGGIKSRQRIVEPKPRG